MRPPLAMLLAGAALTLADDSEYRLGPDSERHEGVPMGEVKSFVFTESKVFEGTTHNWSLYVPKQYDAPHFFGGQLFQGICCDCSKTVIPSQSASPEKRAQVEDEEQRIGAFIASLPLGPQPIDRPKASRSAAAHAYSSMFRKTGAKPLRVFLEDSSGDLYNQFGNWPIANQQMNRALLFKQYDVRFDFAEGYGHNSNHGGSIFPEALRWLWRK